MKNTTKIPHAYLITYRTYGTWLHGDEKLSVHHSLNKVDTPKMDRNPLLKKQMENSLTFEKLILHKSQKDAALEAIIFTCKRYNWHLFAAHVLSNHVHIVLQTPIEINRAMAMTKAYATKFLRERNLVNSQVKCWARGGSTKYIWKKENVFSSIFYVIEKQGRKEAYFCEDWFTKALKNSIPDELLI